MSSSKIPRIIHLIGSKGKPPPKYFLFVEKMRRLHPGWEMIVWDDVKALRVVHTHFPHLADMYRSYAFTVQRTDIFRVLATYLYGGFYMDMDVFCFKSLDELCGHDLVLGVEKVLPAGEGPASYSVRIANYMFGSKPQHGFWLDLLAEAEKRRGNKIAAESDILDTTGPGLLTEVYHTVKNRYDGIELLQNNGRPCPKSCGKSSCHFGDYAVHLHMGSWRWENKRKEQIQ